jgi:predicted O-methyltransferase YrrM
MVRGAQFERIVKDVENQCRREVIHMLGPEKASFLENLILDAKPCCVVECGTAIGYSGLHIGSALLKAGRGRLITLELDHDRATEAERNFRRAGLRDLVDIRRGDARELLKEMQETVDFLFLDNSFGNYHACLMAVLDRLDSGATIVADNVGIGASAMADFLDYVRSHFESRTHWFDVDLPWASRDAMEVSIYSG